MLTIDFRKRGGIAILDLSGKITVDAANFIEMVGWCLANGYSDILCNAGGLDLVDYAGLTVLTIAYKDVVNHSGRIKFVNVPLHIKKMLSLVCLDRVFEIFEEEERALNSFQEDRIISEIQKKQLRRRFKRLPLDIDIEYKTGASDEPFSKGKVLNISAVGCMVFASRIYPLGEVLDIRLSLMPRPGVIQLEAKVVWLVQKEVQPQVFPGLGLEFYQMDSTQQQKLVEFVDRNMPLSCTPQE